MHVFQKVYANPSVQVVRGHFLSNLQFLRFLKVVGLLEGSDVPITAGARQISSVEADLLFRRLT